MKIRTGHARGASVLALVVSAAAPSFAQGAFDWSGVYVGGTVGSATTNSASELSFEEGLFDPEYGYVSDRAASLADGFGTFDPEYANTVTGYMNGDLVGDWIDALSDSSSGASTTLFAGTRWQAGNMTYGGEARRTMGSSDFSYSDAWQETSRFVGSAGSSCCTNYPAIAAFFGDEDNGFDPENAPFSGDPEFGNYDVSMTQDIALDFDASIDGMTSVVATTGMVFGRTHIFAMAGPAFAKVSATTSASISEAGVATTGYSAGSMTNGSSQTERFDFLENAEDFEWSGESNENAVGYVVGAAVETALTNSLLLRLEAEYFNLGSISVYGVAGEEDEGYSIQHKIDGTRVGAGLVFKF